MAQIWSSKIEIGIRLIQDTAITDQIKERHGLLSTTPDEKLVLGSRVHSIRHASSDLSRIWRCSTS